MIMNPSTLQTISQIGVGVGLTLAAIGGFGAYHYGRIVEALKESEASTREQKLQSDITKLLEGNEALQRRLEPFEATARELHPSLTKEDALERLREELEHLDKRTGMLQQQVQQSQAIAPKLDPNGRIMASPFVSFASEFSEGIARSRTLVQEGKLDEAYAIADDLAVKKPDFGLAFFMMGTIEAMKGQLKPAETHLAVAIDKGLSKPDEAWALNNLASIYVRTDRRSEALRSLEKAVLLNPDEPEIVKFRDALKAAAR